MNNYNHTINILIVLNILSISIGYILGKISTNNGVYYNSQQPLGFFHKNNLQQNTTKTNIVIDDSKFIEDINTNSLEKKYQNLGETKQSDEKIASSISKLKNMKG